MNKSLTDEVTITRRRISCDQMLRQIYLDASVNETLRTAPPVGVCRVCTDDYELRPLGVVVRKATLVEVPIQVSHILTNHWRDCDAI